MLEGLSVGAITGLVGVGGGFLIIPALVLLGGLPMQLAVGTSLLIISLKSLSGFTKYLDVLGDYSISWGLIGLFIGLGILGSFAGSALSQRLPQALALMGVYILYTNLSAALGVQPGLGLVAAGALALTLFLWLSAKLRSRRISKAS